MADVNETLAEISAFIRDVAQNQYEAWANDPSDAPDGRDWSEFLGKLADRIDAAAKRETVASSETQSAIHNEPCECQTAHNAAAIREALESTEELLEHFAKPGSMLADAFALHMRDNRAALATPLRNCDVGTPDEQYNRHDKYCSLQPTCRKYLREDSPSTCIWCFATWAQRPYEAATQEGDKS